MHCLYDLSLEFGASRNRRLAAALELQVFALLDTARNRNLFAQSPPHLLFLIPHMRLPLLHLLLLALTTRTGDPRTTRPALTSLPCRVCTGRARVLNTQAGNAEEGSEDVLQSCLPGHHSADSARQCMYLLEIVL